MSDQPVATHRCKNCGEPVGQTSGGDWIHAPGSRGYLFCCQKNVPYGYEAEPGDALNA